MQRSPLQRRVRHWHRTDTLFVGWVVLTLMLAGAWLGSLPGPGEAGHGGGRRIDLEAFKARLDSGELSGHEALWYHVQEQPR
ncbi:MAG TPA: hypothetical protein ENK50_01565 [Sedimenticola sp.]|nr:hypothetical protein [Sedimenticola sp.]